MKFLQDYKTQDHETIIGIDASTHVIGIAVLKAGKIISLSRITLKESHVYERMKNLRLRMEILAERYHPSYVMIESPIMVQNPLTTKNLSYAAGIIIGSMLDWGLEVEEVSPMTWKNWMGYKKVTKKQKDEILAALGQTEGNKVIKNLRKSQIQNKLTDEYPHLKDILEDDNIADALAIALYAYNLLKERGNVSI